MPGRNKMCSRRCRLNVVAFLFCKVVIINFPRFVQSLSSKNTTGYFVVPNWPTDKEFRLRLTYNKAQSPSVSFKPNKENFADQTHLTQRSNKICPFRSKFCSQWFCGPGKIYRITPYIYHAWSSLFNSRKELDNIFMVQWVLRMFRCISFKLGLPRHGQTSNLYCVSTYKSNTPARYRGVLADVIVYIFAHLHSALRTEGKVLDINWLQAAKELVEFNTWWKF